MEAVVAEKPWEAIKANAGARIKVHCVILTHSCRDEPPGVKFLPTHLAAIVFPRLLKRSVLFVLRYAVRIPFLDGGFVSKVFVKHRRSPYS